MRRAMPIIVNLDVMLARRKMRSKELADLLAYLLVVGLDVQHHVVAELSIDVPICGVRNGRQIATAVIPRAAAGSRAVARDIGVFP